MSFGRYDYDRRYRRRFWVGLAKVVGILLVALSIGLFSYQMGVEQFKGRDANLREEVAQLNRQNAELHLVATQMQYAARNAEARAAELEERLTRELPQGARARLLALVTERLNGGLDAERLAFVIRQAEMPRNCQAPENKRLVASTPLTRSGARGVSFANGMITVTADGISVRNKEGNPESWFDPAQPVTIHIAALGGKATEIAGVLPLQASIVHANVEYRFSFAAGSRSTVEVTTDRCPFP